MKAQKSWDTPVADETRDVSDASEDIHGITDDITDDAESAEVDAEAVTLLRKRHRRMTLLVVVVIVASLVSGFCWRRSLQTGSPVNCSHQTGVADEKDYCYGGFKPLQPSGPQLGRSQAGPYFAKAVKGTAAAYDAVRLAAVGGDKDAVNKSAAKARDLSQQAAETLAARTWPKSLTKQIRMVIIEYQERAAIYTNLAGNRNGEAIDWMVFGEFRPSGAQQVIRSALKLPDEPETAVPVRHTGHCRRRSLQGTGDHQGRRSAGSRPALFHRHRDRPGPGRDNGAVHQIQSSERRRHHPRDRREGQLRHPVR